MPRATVAGGRRIDEYLVQTALIEREYRDDNFNSLTIIKTIPAGQQK
jgi:hypothetical protein